MIPGLNRLCLLLGASAVLAGCGGVNDAPQTVPVRGIVTYKGNPMPKISVAFIPATGFGQIAEGTTNEEGRFELQTREPGDGAVEGSYKVALNYVPDTVPGMPGFTDGAKAEPSTIPGKYGDSNMSGLTATVDKDESKNEFKFELTD